MTEADLAEARANLADPTFFDLSPAFIGAWGRRSASSIRDQTERTSSSPSAVKISSRSAS
jgi:hypothetical protein